MNMRGHFQAFYKVLRQDETLLRLLYYEPKDALDDPLDGSKSDILSLADREEVIDDLIATTAKSEDLTTESKCRLFLYFGILRKTRNELFPSQEVIFDVLVNMKWQEKDQRQYWIIDTIDELVFKKRIAGIGKVEFVNGSPISAPEGFLGYRLKYEIGSPK